MKKFLLSLSLVSGLFVFSAVAITDMPPVSANSMILMHADSGEVLCEKNSEHPMLIASTTKIMTALIAAEHLNPNREVIISPAWTRVEGSSMYLRPGESYTVRDLLYGLMLSSGNDAAMALACTVSETADEFAKRMNEKAQELGMENTHFTNPHGLDAEDHYSCAADLSILMAAAMKNPLFSQITSSRSYSTHGATYVNHNKLLWRYNGICGGKTGFTKAAGRCLVTVCERNNLTLICVTLSAPDDWRDHSALYDWAYREYEHVYIPVDKPVANIPVISGAKPVVAAIPAEEISLCVPNGSSVESCVYLPRFIFAKVEQGERAGEMHLSVNGVKKGRWPLCWQEPVDVERETWLVISKMLSFFNR